MNKRDKNQRGQVTIFVIVAIIIVVAIGIYFVLRSSFGQINIPASIEPAYTSFLSCVESDAYTGIDVLESQGGYINLPEFEPGSGYMPFGSQLNFLGNPIPYWYYVSGNNIAKEQVPSKTDMEKQLGEFIDGKIRNCVLDNYYEQGFEISLGEPKTEVTITGSEVQVNLKMDFSAIKGEDTALVTSHKVSVNSNLGTLYDSAKTLYDYEQKNLFLENYAVDTLRLYAPVDGVELTCSPKVWNANEIFSELENATEINTLSLKVAGGDYSLKNKDNEYFVVDVPVSSGVRFINSKDWAHGFEVSPSDESMLIANPIGTQQGLGVLGFCYVPYHFVYDMQYPVLVQIYEGDEIFQFPLAVVVQGNRPREAMNGTSSSSEYPELCNYKNTFTKVTTYDSSLSPVEADISYECFGTTCLVGKTDSSGYLEDYFPQCVNGYILARAEGYADSKELYSTVQPGSSEIIMDKLYEEEISLDVGGNSNIENAIIYFVSDKNSKTIVYPEQKKVNLTEGQYEVQVYIYKNSSIKLDSTTQEQCMEVPQEGIGSLLGLTEKKCFNIEIPEQIVSNVLAGGGKQNYYILESELESSNFIRISAESLPVPKTIANLQDNQEIFDSKGLEIQFS